MKRAILATCITLAAANTYGITIDEYKKQSPQKQMQPYLKTYITGIGEGLFWANVALKGTEQQPLYCPPSNLALETQNYINILNQEIESGRHDNDTDLGLTMLIGLRNVFPCNRPT